MDGPFLEDLKFLFGEARVQDLQQDDCWEYDETQVHISTKTSKPGPIAFSEIEIESFEVFGTFQLSFDYQSATKAVQSGHK